MAELKPCPFCGGEAEFIETEQVGRFPAVMLIKCKNGPCSCQTPTLIIPTTYDTAWTTNRDDWDRKGTLFEIWNRRAGEDGN